jgi:L-ectoine synthase
MLHRRVDSLTGTESEAHGPGWRSRRLITADDGIGYSFHITKIDEGARLEFEYSNHRETVYCVRGRGSVEEVSTGRIVELEPGSLYSVGTGEPHIFAASTEMHLVCVFDPPLHGNEEAD